MTGQTVICARLGIGACAVPCRRDGNEFIVMIVAAAGSGPLNGRGMGRSGKRKQAEGGSEGFHMCSEG